MWSGSVDTFCEYTAAVTSTAARNSRNPRSARIDARALVR
jgi:hypothetical protein